jgi:ferrochelatase
MVDHLPHSTYDAVLLVSFGGPEGMNDVMPFLENVLKGRNVPRERLLEVAKHYELVGGVSPINEQNRLLIAALSQELDTHGPHLPIYFGNRNWHPLLPDTLRQMRADGIKHALAFVTSAYSSYSSCRQYLENISTARQAVGPDAPHVDKIRAFYNHPLFIEANAARVREALAKFPDTQRSSVQVVFTAHSIPVSMAQNCDYEAQLQETSRLVAEQVSEAAGPVSSSDADCSTPAGNDQILPYKLVYQSRSGSPAQPWLGPDVCDYLKELKASGANNVLVAPIGFISDHMEIIYDLDLQARQLCDEIGLNLRRAGTVGTHPSFVKMIRELILERLDPNRERRFLGAQRPRPDECQSDCCLIQTVE